MTLNKTYVSKLILCCVLGASAAVFAGCALSFIMQFFPEMSQAYTEAIRSRIGDETAQYLSVIILMPLIEELLFRQLIYSLLLKILAPLMANIIQAALFGLYHGNIVQFVYAFLMGLLLGYLKERTGSVVYCIAFHCFFNIAGTALEMIPDTYRTYPFMISLMLVSLAASVVLILAVTQGLRGHDGQTA